MARLTQIVVDSSSPSTLAHFWAAALEEFEVRPYDQTEVKRLAELGFTPETDPTVLVDGPSLRICFQQIDQAGTGKGRVHLDLVAEDRPGEVARLTKLGAQIRQDFDGHTGHDFCMTDP